MGSAKEGRVGEKGGEEKLVWVKGTGAKGSWKGWKRKLDELSRGNGQVLNVATLESLVRWSRCGQEAPPTCCPLSSSGRRKRRRGRRRGKEEEREGT